MVLQAYTLKSEFQRVKEKSKSREVKNKMVNGKIQLRSASPLGFGRGRKRERRDTRRRGPTGDLITGGVTALIGTAFVAQTAGVLSRL